jgi:hypothetical protein
MKKQRTAHKPIRNKPYDWFQLMLSTENDVVDQWMGLEAAANLLASAVLQYYSPIVNYKTF